MEHRNWGFYLRLLLMAAGLVLGALVLWQLLHLLLLIFAALLVAVLLRGLADFIETHTPLGERLSLVVAALAIVLLLALFAAVLGTQLLEQARQLGQRIPELLDTVENWLGAEDIEAWLAERARRTLDGASIVSNIAGYSSLAAGMAANFLLVLAGGIYFALHPRAYRDGVLMMVPRAVRDEAAETLTLLGQALRLWLLGQLAAMLFVGALTGFGLWMLGVPSAVALGFIAGLLEFVPFVGPIVSAVPALAVAIAEGPTTAAWVLALYVAIQQIEGFLIMPVVQQRAVELPPALTIFAIVAFGVLLGPLGLLLATPLTVASLVVVKKLWIRETLEEPTTIPGED